MSEEMRTFGYLCPRCGRPVMGTRSVFDIYCNFRRNGRRVRSVYENTRRAVRIGVAVKKRFESDTTVLFAEIPEGYLQRSFLGVVVLPYLQWRQNNVVHTKNIIV